MRDDTLKAQLAGAPPYHMYHPRIAAHPGSAVVLGCLNWDPYCHEMRRLGKRLIGFDPQTTVSLPGVEHIAAVVTPFRGTLDIHGADGGASLMWYHLPKIGEVRSITVEDMLAAAGGDIAGVQMNVEGGEGYILLSMKYPWADQMTVAFHDRPGLDPFIPSARDAIIEHLMQWYDCCRLTSLADNDWWFFLRRNDAKGNGA